MTQRLYYEDSHLREFRARVDASQDRDGGTWIALDRTAFYPGGGGQPPDRGTIDGLSVSEVEERGPEIWHRVERAPAGEHVDATIDWSRRFDHMQQHTGQHILSAAFVEVARAETRSFHLGEAVVTIDVDHAGPADALLGEVEERANEVVWEDREVLTHVVPPGEARRFPLRKPPAVEGDVRIVEVRGFDWSACGGTHVGRTGEVGLIAILGTERYKGGTRVAFVAGRRALRRLRESGDLLRRACLEFTAGESDLLRAVGSLKEERDRLQKRLKPLVRDALEREAQALLEEASRGPHGPVVARHFEGRDPEEAGQLAAMVSGRGGVALFVSGTGTPRAHFSAPAGTISVGALLGELCRRHGGRGGGRPESAQGTVPPERIDAVLREALEAVMAGTGKGSSV
ncbi:MAG TPA: DHHA1 domain-containing protein [Candidatus Eisenbacteria bacterium]|nr:DHHA1 domain-containing protein [Candidatus Eisenbacteria bacterium]